MAKSAGRRKSPPKFDNGTEQRGSAGGPLERELRGLAQDELLSDPKCLVAFTRYLFDRQAPPKSLQELALLPIDKVRQARMWRRRREELRTAYPVDWKERWRGERRQLQLIGRGQDYDWRAIDRWRREMNLEGVTKTAEWNAIAHLIPRPGRPKAGAFWGVIFLLGAYLKHLLHQRRLRWEIIAGLVNRSQESRRWTPAQLRKGWDKRRRDFENLDAEFSLYSELRHLVSVLMLDDTRTDELFRVFAGHALSRLAEKNHREQALLGNLIEAAKKAARVSGLPPNVLGEIERTLKACIDVDILEEGPLGESRVKAQRLVDEVISGAMARHAKSAIAQSPVTAHDQV